MEDSKINRQDHNDDISDKNIIKETLEIRNKESNSISSPKNEFNENKDSQINQIENNIDKGNTKIVEDKTFEDNKKDILTTKSDINTRKKDNNIVKSDKEIVKEKTPEDSKFAKLESNPDEVINKSVKSIEVENKKVEKEKKIEENKKVILTTKSNANINNPKEISTPTPVKAKTKPVKEPPIEKKPFLEFVNDYLIPEIKNVFKLKGKDVNKIYLKKTHRPIAEDICWVIYCEINETCNFWLSFEKDDITSLKSFSLCKNYEKPSIIESFLIDEKKITLKLIISRILQRLNGQKLIGAN